MKDKKITITFNASEKTFEKQFNKTKGLFDRYDLMKLEDAKMNMDGVRISIETLCPLGPM